MLKKDKIFKLPNWAVFDWTSCFCSYMILATGDGKTLPNKQKLNLNFKFVTKK